MQPITMIRDQSIRFEKPNSIAQTQIDEVEIKLAFTNLLENASKYSQPGTKISVKLSQDYSGLTVLFKDQGVGISPDDQPRVFDKFTRIDNELSDTVSGTGLGLYWVKQIIELHKGSIELQSSPGKGSTFTVRLPL